MYTYAERVEAIWGSKSSTLDRNQLVVMLYRTLAQLIRPNGIGITVGISIQLSGNRLESIYVVDTIVCFVHENGVPFGYPIWYSIHIDGFSLRVLQNIFSSVKFPFGFIELKPFEIEWSGCGIDPFGRIECLRF
jgi:hypothetical protein